MKGVFKHCDHVRVSRKTNIIILSLICLILCSLALIILLFNTKNIFRYIDIFRFKCNICLLDFNGYTRLEFFFFYLVSQWGKASTLLGGATLLWGCEDFGPAHHGARETVDEGGGNREGQKKKKRCLRYYWCASSAKNAVPVAQAPCQHRMTEGTVHRITV